MEGPLPQAMKRQAFGLYVISEIQALGSGYSEVRTYGSYLLRPLISCPSENMVLHGGVQCIVLSCPCLGFHLPERKLFTPSSGNSQSNLISDPFQFPFTFNARPRFFAYLNI